MCSEIKSIEVTDLLCGANLSVKVVLQSNVSVPPEMQDSCRHYTVETREKVSQVEFIKNCVIENSILMYL